MLVAAAIGAIYALLILPAPDTVLGIQLYGVVWFILSVSLLFTIAIAYHVYVFWAILWVVFRLVGAFRAPTFDITQMVIDVALPLASLVLLMTSGYLQRAALADG
ncbi:MAG: hypothetical protein WDA16_14375 [Candidatus Thermoplasmatota archaeon]